MKLISLNPLRKRILRLLQPLFEPEAVVLVSISVLRRVNIAVVSEKFNDLDLEQRDELVWPMLEQNLSDDELNRIGMCMLMDPQEGALLIPDLAGTQNEIAHAS
jgi:stress-induced morphogen